MVQNNKVLTVSYGTFSCTLEGFDDSFETMKAIAEYFRDLAADDRYFGSEPPQLDAEMLARIAQRDQARRIEAHRQDDGVVLRATDAAAGDDGETPEPRPEGREGHAGIAMASTHRTSHPGANVSEDEGDDPEDLSAPELAALNPLPEEDAEYEDEASADPVSGTPRPTAPVAAEPVAEQPSPATDSIAAKLQRIRAVVSRADETAGQYDEDADDGMAPQGEPIDAISAAFAAQPAVEPQAEPTPEATKEHGLTAEEPVLAAVEDTAEEEDDTATQPPQPEIVADSLVPESENEDQAATDEPALSEPEAGGDDADDEEEKPLAELLEDGAEAAHDEVETEGLSDVSATQTAADDKLGAQLSQGTLTAEDEAELLDKLAKVEAELFTRRDSRHDLSQEDDLSRLMDAADARMDDPKSDDSRQTYSHLRTAVAAAAAEGTINSTAEPENSDEEYREDLASVVSPRRPAVEVKSERPSSETIAPLRLVAEQRVDVQDDESEPAPVQPRRVSSMTETGDASATGGFARFAEEKGAHSLPELLEAAAAYLSFVEGQEQFSRPQLMNKVRALQLEEFDREESLRSFGQLLRDGKIEKAGGGRFSASSDIGFRPDGKRAAG